MASPLSKRAQGKGVEPSVCKTELPGASPGRASISGPSSKSRTTQWHCVDRGATPRGSIFIGHEEDSNPRRSDRRDTRGSTEVPDHFNSAKALVATHAAGIGERPVQFRLADRSPVAQSAERPTLNREVDGANPSGAATSSLCTARHHAPVDQSGDRRTDIANAWRASANPAGSRSAHCMEAGA